MSTASTSIARGSALDEGGVVVCSCHGEPMQRNGKYWRCSVEKRVRDNAWQRRNPERVSLYNQQWRERNPGAGAAATAAWRVSNLDRARAMEVVNSAKRRALARGNEHEPWARTEVLARGNGICHICAQPVNPTDWHVEHVVPIARGGRDALDNLLPAHPLCNQRKGDR